MTVGVGGNSAIHSLRVGARPARARGRASRSASTRAAELRRLHGGVAAAAKEREAGKALINFLKTPPAVPVLKAKGMEPMTR